jgi:hypothetical protein
VAALRRQDPNMTATEISRRIGRSRERVRQILVALGLPSKTIYSPRREDEPPA